MGVRGWAHPSFGMTPTIWEYNRWYQQSQILKSRCHTKRRCAPILLLVWQRQRPVCFLMMRVTYTIRGTSFIISGKISDNILKIFNHRPLTMGYNFIDCLNLIYISLEKLKKFAVTNFQFFNVFFLPPSHSVNFHCFSFIFFCFRSLCLSKYKTFRWHPPPFNRTLFYNKWLCLIRLQS